MAELNTAAIETVVALLREHGPQTERALRAIWLERGLSKRSLPIALMRALGTDLIDRHAETSDRGGHYYVYELKQ